MPPSPFDFPVRPLARLLASLGQVERLLRAAVRQLGRGSQAFHAVGELRGRLRAGTRQRRPGRPAALDRKGPVVYLPAVAWGYRFQRPQQLALALAASGHPVLYVDGFLRSRVQPARLLQEMDGGVSVLRVRVPRRPDPYREVLSASAARRLADLLAAGLRVPPSMLLVQLPFWAPLARELRQRWEAPLVYDCLDLHTEFPGVPEEIGSAEEQLGAVIDLATASSPTLCRHIGRFSANVLHLPNAVALEDFPVSPSRAASETTVIGYVGALSPWFDAEAVREAALRRPRWIFRLAGRSENPDVATLARLPNVELLGEIPYWQVPGFLGGLDALIIPFADTPLTRAVDPVKLYEAFAMGLPVVARDLPHLGRWHEPFLYTYRTPAELVAALERALAGQTPEIAAQRRALVEGESWKRRAADLLAHLGELPAGP